MFAIALADVELVAGISFRVVVPKPSNVEISEIYVSIYGTGCNFLKISNLLVINHHNKDPA